MELLLLIFVGGIIFFIFCMFMAKQDVNKNHEELYKQGPEANTARLKAQMAEYLENNRHTDVEQVLQVLSLERSNGIGWDTAIKIALPKIANVQLLQIRNGIHANVQAGRSEQEAMETVIRGFIRPSPTPATPLETLSMDHPPQAPDPSSFLPRDIGRGLAVSLDTSCKFDEITDNERSLLRAAKVPVERYYQELLLLCGFAQDYAIFSLIGQSEVGKQVLAGYREAWQNVGKSSPSGAALFQLFVKRCPEYAKAAREIEQVAREGAVSVSRIALIFGGHIQAETSTPTENGSAQMLAIVYADSYYFAHFEGTAEALKAAKLFT